MDLMDRTELAWAAGFWDGEGWANLVRHGRGDEMRPMAQVNQAGNTGIPEVLVRLRRAVGFGAIQGPCLVEGREPLYRWQVSSRRDVERLAELLGPLLGDVKRKQLEDVIRSPLVLADWSMNAPEEQRAWAAGLWDGEGSICLLKHRSHAGHFVPEAAVTQASADGIPEVLSRIASIGARGFLYGPFPQEPPYQPVYRWKLFRLEEIKEFVELIRPWLGGIKVAQAEHVFAVLDRQPKLPRGNPAWGSHKTHCVNGHEYETARVRPFSGRGKSTAARRASKQCLACLREYAWRKRAEKKSKSGG